MVRLAERNDLDDVYLLICELEGAELNKHDFEALYRMTLESGRDCIFLYDEEGETLGLLHLEVRFELHHAGKVAEIDELIVSDKARGKGIGSRLAKAAEAKAREEGCERLEVCSNLHREKAHSFYMKNGFERRSYMFSKPLGDE